MHNYLSYKLWQWTKVFNKLFNIEYKLGYFSMMPDLMKILLLVRWVEIQVYEEDKQWVK